MKAIDIIAEFSNAYVFIEMKDFDDPDMYNTEIVAGEDDLRTKRDHFKWLKNYLKYKYRDSYLYRNAEGKVNKPIHYICLLSFDNALNLTMQKILRKELPVGKASRRWQKEIVRSCQVMNLDTWNSSFPKWPVRRVTFSKST